MPKFLVKASYTASGAAGVLKDGGSGRASAVEALVASAGGSVESMYWALGSDDFFCIADLPDLAAVASISLTVGASGAAQVETIPLLSAADVDDAVKRRAAYRAPGS